MALINARLSDKSKELIPPGTGARVVVTFYDGSVKRRADLTDEEFAELLPFATEIEERPARRRPRKKL